ncbi:RluA family pseudouridine synthase [Xylophilus ampelinus]|uniref:Dual-specificity RNA pseudouridine synthase RluA n=1 Tax=Xylophilus ampelinus TaxID=54067 RepID=A0A318SL64_9BURK|nr:RluA family pseudouridine synthase [Xylophilus ampelinus]MCS4509079.1 RluA family pseudouridine synthase [Xylophilus ampelinus]PYE79894.1 ribosomal large subunit pseudouridine synthase A [Xylophilus ampelinus]
MAVDTASLPAALQTARTGLAELPAHHADPHLLVVEKPAGLLAVPGRGEDKQDCLSARVQALYPDALVVHRLDMATSGLVVFARSPAVQRMLGDAFAERAVHKEYEAVVSGRPAGGAADAQGWRTIDLPLGADWPRRPMQKVDAEAGKPSLTRWRPLSHDPVAGTARLRLTPVTGRTHQLRVHLRAIGHPILGDALYAPPAVLAAAPRLLLHAVLLAFAHPVTGAALRFRSAVPF